MRRTDRTRTGVTAGVVWAVAVLILAGCAEEGEPAGSPDGNRTVGVVPLAKVQGWRDALGPVAAPFAVLEIAYDRETAERAWRENVPEDLAPGEGVPDEPALYGELDDVDFDRQVVLVWSSGQSGSCPGWLAGVAIGDDGTVEIRRRDTSMRADPGEDRPTACTEDYNAYRMVVAVDRDRLPVEADLPSEEVRGIPDGLVTTYPAR